MSKIFVVSNGKVISIEKIPGFPGYAASREGGLYSAWIQNKDKLDKNGNEIIKNAGRWHISDRWIKLKLRICKKTGRRYTGLRKDCGRRKSFITAPLILLTFKGPPPESGMVCRHLDDDRLNDNEYNLAWGTPKQNQDDSRKNGTMYKVKGEDCGLAKITNKEALQIRYEYKVFGIYQYALAKRHGISQAAVSLIVNNKTFKDIA